MCFSIAYYGLEDDKEEDKVKRPPITILGALEYIELSSVWRHDQGGQLLYIIFRINEDINEKKFDLSIFFPYKMKIDGKEIIPIPKPDESNTVEEKILREDIDNFIDTLNVSEECRKDRFEILHNTFKTKKDENLLNLTLEKPLGNSELVKNELSKRYTKKLKESLANSKLIAYNIDIVDDCNYEGGKEPDYAKIHITTLSQNSNPTKESMKEGDVFMLKLKLNEVHADKINSWKAGATLKEYPRMPSKKELEEIEFDEKAKRIIDTLFFLVRFYYNNNYEILDGGKLIKEPAYLPGFLQRFFQPHEQESPSGNKFLSSKEIVYYPKKDNLYKKDYLGIMWINRFKKGLASAVWGSIITIITIVLAIFLERYI